MAGKTTSLPIRLKSNAKNGEEDQLETSGCVYIFSPPTPDAKDSADFKLDNLVIPPYRPPGDFCLLRWPYCLPIRWSRAGLDRTFHEMTEVTGHAVKGYNCFPADLKRLEDGRDVWRFEVLGDARAKPLAGKVGSPEQHGKLLLDPHDVQPKSTANELSRGRPGLRRWASWPLMHPIPWVEEERGNKQPQNCEAWFEMEERAHQG